MSSNDTVEIIVPLVPISGQRLKGKFTCTAERRKWFLELHRALGNMEKELEEKYQHFLVKCTRPSGMYLVYFPVEKDIFFHVNIQIYSTNPIKDEDNLYYACKPLVDALKVYRSQTKIMRGDLKVYEFVGVGMIWDDSKDEHIGLRVGCQKVAHKSMEKTVIRITSMKRQDTGKGKRK